MSGCGPVWLTGYLAGWLAVQLAAWLAVRLSGWHLADLLADCWLPAAGLAGGLVGWLAAVTAAAAAAATAATSPLESQGDQPSLLISSEVHALAMVEVLNMVQVARDDLEQQQAAAASSRQQQPAASRQYSDS